MNGLISVLSTHGSRETAQRLVQAITSRGLFVFARIDHAKNAAEAGVELRPTEVILFGSPQGTTTFVVQDQVSGIDLPARALVWQDEDSRVWLTFNDVKWLADRHGLGSLPGIDAMTAGIAAIVQEAADGK